MNKYLVVILTLLSTSPAALADAVSARSISCNGFPEPLSVGLQRFEGTGPLGGGATHHFHSTRYANCRVTETDVVCYGTWSSQGGPSTLRITTLPDGTYRGQITLPGGELKVIGCLLSWNDLSF